jgi:ribosomal protein S18 acetylase RimI-like enzyme
MNPPEAPAPAIPIVLDIEASGFGSRSYPIEIGLALEDESTFCSLITPEPEWTHWDPSAELVHHIDRAMLLQHGVSARSVADTLNKRLTGSVVYSDGWAHDYSWLALLFDAAGATPRFRLESLRSLLNDAEAARWHETKHQVVAALRYERHRASADARVLQLTLLCVKYGESIGARAHSAKQVDEMAALDMLTLAEHYRSAYGHCDRPWLRARHATALAEGGRVIAEHLQKQLAGYVLLRPIHPDEWEMTAFNLHPWYRSTSLYRRLLTRSLAHLISHGASKLTSLVLPTHETSIRFHERLGFTCAARTPEMLRYEIPVAELARRLRLA